MDAIANTLQNTSGYSSFRALLAAALLLTEVCDVILQALDAVWLGHTLTRALPQQTGTMTTCFHAEILKSSRWK